VFELVHQPRSRASGPSSADSEHVAGQEDDVLREAQQAEERAAAQPTPAHLEAAARLWLAAYKARPDGTTLDRVRRLLMAIPSTGTPLDGEARLIAVEVLTALGRFFGRPARLLEATALVEEALANAPQDGDFLIQLAVLRAESGAYDDARRLAAQAVEATVDHTLMARRRSFLTSLEHRRGRA
jgi:tetratricopeptide (TPR) repeat protein